MPEIWIPIWHLILWHVVRRNYVQPNVFRLLCFYSPVPSSHHKSLNLIWCALTWEPYKCPTIASCGSAFKRPSTDLLSTWLNCNLIWVLEWPSHRQLDPSCISNLYFFFFFFSEGTFTLHFGVCVTFILYSNGVYKFRPVHDLSLSFGCVG